ncbi:MAG: hypothetical protein JNJ89_18330 [Rubrivivax sp.]|nr:hypothetical protein [Rubrivivax sp.]
MVTLADLALPLSMQACKAGEWTWALAAVDAGDPRRVAEVLEACRRSAQANIRGEVRGRHVAVVPGATPNVLSAQWWLQGRRPDGSEVHARLVLFAHGTQVFQATVVGSRPAGAAADPFFEALQVRS